jgi:threonine/homoserine/homoserine lactone efflux protein
MGVTFAFAAVAQPGPLQSYLVNQALARGWRRTAPAAFAPLVSDGPIIAVVLLVLAHVPAWLVRALQGAGGVFLLYLAAGAYRTWRRLGATASAPSGSARGTLLRATLVNLLNPNPYLGWSLVMGPTFLQGWRERPAHGVALLAGFYATMVAGLLGTMVLASAAGGIGPRVQRTLIGVSVLALAGFGACLLAMATRAVF